MADLASSGASLAAMMATDGELDASDGDLADEATNSTRETKVLIARRGLLTWDQRPQLGEQPSGLAHLGWPTGSI